MSRQTLIGVHLSTGHRISRVPIVRYGEALGRVDLKPVEERHSLARDDLFSRMSVALGGLRKRRFSVWR